MIQSFAEILIRGKIVHNICSQFLVYLLGIQVCFLGGNLRYINPVLAGRIGQILLQADGFLRGPGLVYFVIFVDG